jgi:hypothetical protein
MHEPLGQGASHHLREPIADRAPIRQLCRGIAVTPKVDVHFPIDSM